MNGVSAIGCGTAGAPARCRWNSSAAASAASTARKQLAPPGGSEPRDARRGQLVQRPHGSRIIERVPGPRARAASVGHEQVLADALARLHAEGRYRVFADLERHCGRFPCATWHGPDGPVEVTVWCSNDYLGMGQHPIVLKAMADALEQVGAGAGGTRNIAGTSHAHVLLERELADLHRKPAALLFTSGYAANEAALSTLARLLPGCMILSDEKNHASMIEGIRRSGAEKRIFRHNDPADLERHLGALEARAGRRSSASSRCTRWTGTSRRSGSSATVARATARSPTSTRSTRWASTGPAGAGVAERDGVLDRLTVIQGTLAKAFGVVGGYIAGSAVGRGRRPELRAGLHLHDRACRRSSRPAPSRACGISRPAGSSASGTRSGPHG